jgi:transposase
MMKWTIPNDAFAITQVSQGPHIDFVPIKTDHQQEVICLHRIRQRLIKKKSRWAINPEAY